MDLRKAVLVLAVIVLVLASPFIVAVTGLSYYVEDYALADPDSGFREWTARKLLFAYLLVLNHRKRMEFAKAYIETFDEEALTYDKTRYKKVFWIYADECTHVLRQGKRGIGYYRYAEAFPDDRKYEQAMNLAEHYGYRDALGDE